MHTLVHSTSIVQFNQGDMHMEPTVITEISDGIFRLSTFVPEVAAPAGFTFNQFLVRGDEPLLFHTGLRKLFPLEWQRCVAGMSEGESRTVRIEPADAYGERNDELVVRVARNQAPDGISVDDRVRIGDTPAVVTEVTDLHVEADANHPLAGETLTFDVEVVEIVG